MPIFFTNCHHFCFFGLPIVYFHANAMIFRRSGRFIFYMCDSRFSQVYRKLATNTQPLLSYKRKEKTESNKCLFLTCIFITPLFRPLPFCSDLVFFFNISEQQQIQIKTMAIKLRGFFSLCWTSCWIAIDCSMIKYKWDVYQFVSGSKLRSIFSFI